MSTPDSPTLRDRLFVATQYVIPQHFLSRLVYRLTRSRSDGVKNALISSFMRGFSPDMSDAVRRDPLAYESFNEFFTRALRPGARPIDPNDSVLVSPVDGAISQIGHLDGSQMMQAKGHYYSLEALLDFGASHANWASRFSDGRFATLYLAPFNYHPHSHAAGRYAARSLVRSRTTVQRQCRYSGGRAGTVCPKRADRLYI